MNFDYEDLSGKTILLIGTGGIGRRHLWNTFAELNLNVFLVHPKWTSYASESVQRFVEYNFEDENVSDNDHSTNIIKLLGDDVSKLSGCCTFVDYYLHITAILCEILEFKGLSPDVAFTVRSKPNTYKFLEERDETKMFIPCNVRIENESDIWQIKKLPFPAILKPEYGTAGRGVTKVFSLEDCVNRYIKLIETQEKKNMVLMEYLKGISYNVDIIIIKGCVIKCICTETSKFHVGNTELDEIAETVTNYSPCLSSCSLEALCDAVSKCCLNLGLTNGVFNAEMISTSSGFKLVEINGRPPSYRRGSVFRFTHCIDVHIAQVLISLGKVPTFYDAPRIFGVGCYIYAAVHKSKLSNIDGQIDAICKRDKSVIYIQNHVTAEDCLGNYRSPFANIVVIDRESQNIARKKLIEVFKELKLSPDNFDIEQMTSSCLNTI